MLRSRHRAAQKKGSPWAELKVNPATLERVKELTLSGASQKAIAQELGVHRNSIYRYQRDAGLHAQKRPALELQNQILKLLQKGITRKRVETMLGVSEWDVRRIARLHEISSRNKLPAAKVLRLVADILDRRGSAAALARKHGCGYKQALRLAHVVLKCDKFVSNSQPPLSSYLPSLPSPGLKKHTGATAEERVLRLVDFLNTKLNGAGLSHPEKFGQICFRVFLAHIPGEIQNSFSVEERTKVHEVLVAHIDTAIGTLRSAESSVVH